MAKLFDVIDWKSFESGLQGCFCPYDGRSVLFGVPLGGLALPQFAIPLQSIRSLTAFAGVIIERLINIILLTCVLGVGCQKIQDGNYILVLQKAEKHNCLKRILRRNDLSPDFAISIVPLGYLEDEFSDVINNADSSLISSLNVGESKVSEGEIVYTRYCALFTGTAIELHEYKRLYDGENNRWLHFFWINSTSTKCCFFVALIDSRFYLFPESLPLGLFDMEETLRLWNSCQEDWRNWLLLQDGVVQELLARDGGASESADMNR